MPHSCGNVGTSRALGWENRRDRDLSPGSRQGRGMGCQGFWSPPHMGLSPHSLTMEPRAHIKESTESLVQEPLFNTFQKLQA